MSRAQSYNWEISIDDETTIYPKTIAEFSEGEEGRIEVVDGNRKYKISDQIGMVDEVEIDVLIKKDLAEVKALESLQSGTRDIFVIGRDGAGNEALAYLFANCGVTKGKKSAFDRSSKAEETMKFFLTPESIARVD